MAEQHTIIKLTTPYLPKSALQAGKANIATFFKRAAENKNPIPLTRDVLGLPEKEFGESVMDIRFSPPKA